jgi:hypothetical protein
MENIETARHSASCGDKWRKPKQSINHRLQEVEQIGKLMQYEVIVMLQTIKKSLNPVVGIEMVL